MFNEFFMQLLQDRNITAYKLSQDTGISNALISNWKSGRQLPKFDNIITLCNYLNISADYLLTGKEKGTILSDDEKELIAYYNKLTEVEKIKLVSRAETLAEQYNNKTNKEIRLNDQTDDDEEIIINVAARGLGVTSVTTTKKAMEDLLALEPEDIDL